MKTKETRAAKISIIEDVPMVLEGWPILYEETTTIHAEGGDYKEVIHRGALDETDLSDSTLIYNHDATRIPLARSGRTMTLEVTDRGLHMVASLSSESQQAREVYTAIQRGDLSGMSFSFVVPEGGSRYDGATGTRHINKIAKVYEVSVCPWPAYQNASVEARDAMHAARDVARQGLCNRIARIKALASAQRILSKEKANEIQHSSRGIQLLSAHGPVRA